MSANDLAQEHTDKAARWANPLTVCAGALLLIHFTLKYLPAWLHSSKWPENGGIDLIGLALATLAMLPWVAMHLSSAKLGGIDFAFREVGRRQDLTERAIRQLRFIVDGFLTRSEYKHLLNIRSGQEYAVNRNESGPLDAELRRLRALGLIEGAGIGEFTRAYGQKRRIDKSFRLTERGAEYLRMRTENQHIAAKDVAVPAARDPLPEKDAVLDALTGEE
jgi:DNA-binding PadR family transcriptional regulator